MKAIVPENYDLPGGRQISLDVVILQAANPVSPSRAIFLLQGGPGQRTTSTIEDESEVWKKVGRTHDLVFIDQRGTGISPDLHCANPNQDKSVLLRDLWPAENLVKCARRLSATVDLTRYTTSEAARDLNNVRAALSYDQIGIIAYSYGTRLAQEYLRHYDHSVRATLLLGPEAPGAYVPAGLAREAELSLTEILNRCKADKECSTAFPDVFGDLKKLKAMLNGTGLVLHKGSQDQAHVLPISSGVVASYLRMYLYAVSGAASLPRLIHTLADEDKNQALLASIATWREQFEDAAPWGLYMAITCNEDLPFLDEGKERALAAGTLIGSFRIDQQIAACRNWPRGQISPQLHTPVHSNTPILLLAGQFDPATPSSNSEKIISHMPNGRLVIVPNRSHTMFEDWGACLEDVTANFLENANPRTVDTACVNRLRLPKFEIASQ
ncbi:alpha/beta fold hydrolase [Duganella sp. FT109W]|uniref:Alpha/beta fold hydrolase n=1 Tax=Duganella margarita TaxID=2692170 RepID=A0ABW9WQQ9_9BURK|nr:alpha/beta fold hydrolase [Duganella margarita]MYN43230.1 alpha/beta fold hydrolase [Duganella margarita]